MLIGAHVSTGGGLTRSIERGSELDCDAIQIFHQSPRMWRPTAYSDEDFAAFREAMEKSRIETVVLHAGARKGEPQAPSVKRAGNVIQAALESSDSCPILLENTAGTQGPLGRNFDELAELVEAAGGGARLGTCLDCCHLFAAGFDISTPQMLARVVEEHDDKVGADRLRCVHVNDSKVPFGANRDRHANLGEGALGRKTLGAFLSAPRFEELPALIETPGPDGRGPDRREVRAARRLRREGLKARSP